MLEKRSWKTQASNLPRRRRGPIVTPYAETIHVSPTRVKNTNLVLPQKEYFNPTCSWRIGIAVELITPKP